MIKIANMRAAFRSWLSIFVAVAMLMAHAPVTMAALAPAGLHGTMVQAMDMGGCKDCAQPAPTAAQCQAGLCQTPGILSEAAIAEPASLPVAFEDLNQRLSGLNTKPPTSPA